LGPDALEGAVTPATPAPLLERSQQQPGQKSSRGGLEALHQRVLARLKMNRCLAAQEAAILGAEREVAICEDAMAVHGVLEQLFARGEGKNSAASEAELLSAVTSTSFARQFRRPMDRETTQTALAFLTAKASDWYKAEAAVHSRTAGSYLRRVAGGSSKAAMKALLTTHQELKAKHTELKGRFSKLRTGHGTSAPYWQTGVPPPANPVTTEASIEAALPPAAAAPCRKRATKRTQPWEPALEPAAIAAPAAVGRSLPAAATALATALPGPVTRRRLRLKPGVQEVLAGSR